MRASLAEEKELLIAKKYFDVYENRCSIPENSLVIPRFSYLPFPKEFEEDMKYKNCDVINTYRQHRYIADLSNWYQDLEDITPKTWFRFEDVPKHCGPVVLKGETNSKKYFWHTHMYAENWDAANKVFSNLMMDSLIGAQNIYIREYVPLKTFDYDVTGIPITEEYRFFILDGKVVTSGFYWSSHCELLENKELNINPDNVPKEFIRDIIDRVGKNSRFFVVDVARAQTPYNPLYNQHGLGEWIVVELNDGMMSGISENDPNVLYSNMKDVLTK